MPDPRDFLPQPPWEGPPIPRGRRQKERLGPHGYSLKVCTYCGKEFEDLRSGEEKLLDTIFRRTTCSECRGKG